ncbi:MAG: tRNA lysidine(34) synthetase TilS [Opitutaceae bacterium]
MGALIPRSRFHPAVFDWAEAETPHPNRARRGRALRNGSREAWGIAFSGGPDSLALLLLVWAHWPERRDRLCALHFDHRMRAGSKADAAFCRRVCLALGIRYAGGIWRRRPGEPSEAVAREARMAFIAHACHGKGIGAVWFGHQQDDVAETMLMRLARGSGAGGLAAPRPVSPVAGGRSGRDTIRLRPLLTLKKAEIVGALRACKIPWREDRTNATDAYFRNRIRSRVVRRWAEASGRDAAAGAAWSRELLQEDDEALEAWTNARRVFTPGGRLRLDRLDGCPRAVWRRALHRWIRLQGSNIGSVSRAGFGTLLGAIERGRPIRQSLGPASFAILRGRHLMVVGEGRRSS